jgi:hypothetical protein
MNRIALISRAALFAGAVLLLAGQPARAESARVMDNYVVHYSAFPTDVLDASVARNYQIKRSKERGLLNIAIRQKSDDSPSGKAVSGMVSAQWSNLTGQMGNIPIREVREQDAIYYLGEFAIRDEEILTFTLQVSPDNDMPPETIKFRKQFIVGN